MQLPIRVILWQTFKEQYRQSRHQLVTPQFHSPYLQLPWAPAVRLRLPRCSLLRLFLLAYTAPVKAAVLAPKYKPRVDGAKEFDIISGLPAAPTRVPAGPKRSSDMAAAHVTVSAAYNMIAGRMEHRVRLMLFTPTARLLLMLHMWLEFR